MPVDKNNIVKIDYKATLEDGTEFESSEKHKPLEFQVGKNQVIKGIEKAVIGMETGEEKKIKISPVDAFGYLKPFLFKEISKEEFSPNLQIEDRILLKINNYDEINAKILGFNENKVIVDFNHPLAGKFIYLYLKVLKYS